MTESEVKELSPLEEFLQTSRDEVEQVRRELKEISLLVEQSQGEVEKLAQRNASITAHLHQMQSHFETVPRDDIQSTYEAFSDAQQRLFTMRGQLEKLQSDEAHLKRYGEYLAKALQVIEGGPQDSVMDLMGGGTSTIQQIIEAQEDERRTISRQLHDGPAQALSNFILQTEIAVRLFNTDHEKAKEELNNLKAAAASTFARIRDFIFDLRPMMLDDLGLVPTAKRYIEAYSEKTGVEVSTVITGTERRLEPHLEVLTFRALQSLLRNVRDYAQATQAKVMIDIGEQELRVSVEDNGRGVDIETMSEEDHKKYGYTTLEDRIDQVGGSLEVTSTAGEGTRVAYTIPLGA
ncbi:MAG: sensor histidine kinase [Anaerolineales bacterium]|jgi:two-component system sensor histidine kinase DegS